MKKFTTILLASAAAVLLGGAAVPPATPAIPTTVSEAQVFTAKDWVHGVLGDTSVQVWISQGEAGPTCNTVTMGACYSAEKNSIHVNPSIVGIDDMEALVEAAMLR